jgi:hypothetical protein
MPIALPRAATTWYWLPVVKIGFKRWPPTCARYGVTVEILVADLTDETGIRAVEETLRSTVLIRWLTTPAPRRWRRFAGEVRSIRPLTP